MTENTVNQENIITDENGKEVLQHGHYIYDAIEGCHYLCEGLIVLLESEKPIEVVANGNGKAYKTVIEDGKEAYFNKDMERVIPSCAHCMSKGNSFCSYAGCTLDCFN